MADQPLVSIMIATKDRHDDLAVTVKDLRRQVYPSLEMLVIDDGSTPPIEPIVLEYWPNARIVRHEKGWGQNIRRNQGFQLAAGKYILHLDDDCSPVDANAIARSVQLMEANPRWAGLSYYVWNGMEIPKNLDTSQSPSGYSLAYLGAAALMRKEALDQTAGYREFFISAGEEEELSMQMLQRGWGFAFRPEIVCHHRYSSVNRNKPTVWHWSLRNRLWTILLHIPVSRIPVEAGWKIVNGAYDAIRLGRMKLFARALMEAVQGAGKVLALRKPFGPLAVRRYDALRAYGTLPYNLFDDPPKQGWANFKRWAMRWPNRLREGSRWSKQKNVGKGDFPTHEHELGK